MKKKKIHFAFMVLCFVLLNAATPYDIQVEINGRFQPDATFMYTLDGTDPTLSSMIYERPIKISESCQLKVAGFRDKKQVTRISTANYWKLPESHELPDLYISDLQASDEVIGKVLEESYAVEKCAKFDRSVDGNALSNRGLKFPRGVEVPSRSEITFPIQTGDEKFVALAAVDDECMWWDHPGGSSRWPQWAEPVAEPTSYRISKIIFEVYIDGKLAECRFRNS